MAGSKNSTDGYVRCLEVGGVLSFLDIFLLDEGRWLLGYGAEPIPADPRPNILI